MDHPKPWLRYVDADDIEDQTLDLDNMKVRNAQHDDLGTVDGLIVDEASGRTVYVVVNAGGWFKTKQFLVPIGQLHLDSDRDALVVNLSKETINQFPGFDTDEFDTLSEADIKRINDSISSVFEPGQSYGAEEPYSAAWNRPSYRSPDWWTAGPLLPNRMGASAFEKPVEYPSVASDSTGRRAAGEQPDSSPHFDGRAQPGDVLGVETGGEESHLGDTRETEDDRRRKAEKSSRK